MIYPISQGPWTVKTLITDYLSWDIPRRIVAFRNAWQIDDVRLPTPELFLSHEPPSLDHWPTITTMQMAMTRAVRADYSGGLNPIYMCTYAMRTYIWVRADGADLVTESRDRLTAVVRTALLDRPCLVASLVNGNHEVLLDETTLREEYSDITFVKGDRAVAGAYISYDVTLQETITRADIAELSEIQVSYDSGTGELTELDENVVTQIIV